MLSDENGFFYIKGILSQYRSSLIFLVTKCNKSVIYLLTNRFLFHICFWFKILTNKLKISSTFHCLLWYRTATSLFNISSDVTESCILEDERNAVVHVLNKYIFLNNCKLIWRVKNNNDTVILIEANTCETNYFIQFVEAGCTKFNLDGLSFFWLCLKNNVTTGSKPV